MSRRATITLLAIGAALLIGAPATWYLTQPDQQVGDLEAALSQPTDPAAPVSSSGDQPPATEDVEGQDEAREDSTSEQPEPLPEPSSTSPTLSGGQLAGPLTHHPVPTSIRIPSLDVAAPVVPVALEPDGAMEIPDDVAEVGWYEPGVRPGQEGSAVLSGHVDSREQGPGALFELRSVDVGDTILTTGADGSEQSWQVVARDRYGKAELPIDDIFVRDGPPRLVLITCGGDYDAATRSYTDNVVVYAEPA